MAGMAKSPKRHGLVTRPIEREVWSREAMAAGELALNQRAKLSLSPSEYRHRMAGGATAGSQIAGSLGGGVYTPTTAPKTTSGGNTPGTT